MNHQRNVPGRTPNTLREALNKSVLSFPRKREPSQFNKLDSRFRGNDDLISVSLEVDNSRHRKIFTPAHTTI